MCRSFSAISLFLTRRSRRAMPIVGRYLTINSVSALTRMYRVSCSSPYKEPKPTPFLPLPSSYSSTSLLCNVSFYLAVAESHPSSFLALPYSEIYSSLSWLGTTPFPFPSIFLRNAHVGDAEKSTPPSPLSRATEVRGIISRIKADSARYQATP